MNRATCTAQMDSTPHDDAHRNVMSDALLHVHSCCGFRLTSSTATCSVATVMMCFRPAYAPSCCRNTVCVNPVNACISDSVAPDVNRISDGCTHRDRSSEIEDGSRDQIMASHAIACRSAASTHASSVPTLVCYVICSPVHVSVLPHVDVLCSMQA